MGKIYKIFGGDFDFYDQSKPIDILEKLRHLAKFLPMAESAEMCVIGGLEQKDAFRIRIKGIYSEEA